VSSVLAQRLPVVAGQHDDGARGGAGGQDRLQQRLQGGVRGRHHPVVRVGPEAGGERLRRCVGEVRLVEVDEGEGALPAHALQPPTGRGYCLGPLPLRHQEGRGGLGAPQAVVVDVEAAVQTEARVQGERAHEPSRLPAAGLQQRGERGLGRGEAEPGVVAHAVLQRVTPGEQVRVRRQRHHVVGVGLLEAHASLRQAVDPGRLRALPPVAAEGVGTEGVDRDEQDREAGVTAYRGAEDTEHDDDERPQGRRQHGELNEPEPPRRARPGRLDSLGPRARLHRPPACQAIHSTQLPAARSRPARPRPERPGRREDVALQASASFSGLLDRTSPPDQGRGLTARVEGRCRRPEQAHSRDLPRRLTRLKGSVRCWRSVCMVNGSSLRNPEKRDPRKG
jgi:hypothetical protein